MDTRSLDILKTLVEINEKINSFYSDTNALLVYILKSAMRLVDCESSSVLLLGNTTGTLHFEVSLGPKATEMGNSIVKKQSIAGWVAENNAPVIINNVASDVRYSVEVQRKIGYEVKNLIAVPICIKENCIGVVELLNKSNERDFDKDDLYILKILGNQVGLVYQTAGKSLGKNEYDNLAVKNLVSNRDYHTFIAKSLVILDLLHVIEEVAITNSSVLITGESGVGKELFAEQLHLRSPRRSKPFIRVNCAALSPSLLESELFGHVKGAFTDATSNVEGRFQAADGGSLFLDEIGEFPLDLQVKLLRVIQTKKFEQVGSSKTISVDVRIVAATNRDLEAMVKKGTFRADLYYRLNVLPINVPALRERKDDIEPLAEYFLKQFSDDTKKSFIGFSQLAIKALYNYYWPGNIRELENTVERACVLGTPPYVQVSDLRLPGTESEQENVEKKDNLQVDEDSFADEYVSFSDEEKTLKAAILRFKRAYVCNILDQTSWNQTKAGKILGIQRTYLSRLLNELHIREEKK